MTRGGEHGDDARGWTPGGGRPGVDARWRREERKPGDDAGRGSPVMTWGKPGYLPHDNWTVRT
jgi:hypothetical protein